MNSSRRIELHGWLRHELSRQSRERNLSSTGRVVWLLDQVENYVERWLGNPQTAGASSNDLFQMIEIGAEAVSAELAGLDRIGVAESWHHFLALLAAFRAGATVEAQQLAKMLMVFRSEFQS